MTGGELFASFEPICGTGIGGAFGGVVAGRKGRSADCGDGDGFGKVDG